MKKYLCILLVIAVVTASVFAQSANEKKDLKTIDKLTFVYAPNFELDVFLKAFEPLKTTLPAELAKYGYTVKEVDLSLGTSQDVIAEGCASGTIDIGCVGAATYVLFEKDGITPFVQVGRDGYENDSYDIKKWNTGNIAPNPKYPSAGSRSLIFVNILTDKGNHLFNKANAGTLTWDDLNNAQWALGKSTSTTGYILPGMWLNEHFGTGVGSSEKGAESLSKCTIGSGTSALMTSIILGQADVVAAYENALYSADSTDKAFKQAYPELAAQGKKAQDIIKVIGVTDRSANEPFIAGTAEYMTPEFIDALQKAFMTLCNSDDPALNKPFRDINVLKLAVPDLKSFDVVRKMVSSAK